MRGSVQCKRCLMNRYQWSTANRRRYSFQSSDKGGISSPIKANHIGLLTRGESSSFSLSTSMIDIGWCGERRKCFFLQR